MQRKPISSLAAVLKDSDAPLWRRIVTLFERHGVEEPPFWLRDELVVMLDRALAYDELKAEHENVMNSICRIKQ